MKKKGLIIFSVIFTLVLGLSLVHANENSNGWIKFADDHFDVVGEIDGEVILIRKENQQDKATVSAAIFDSASVTRAKGRHTALPPVSFKGLNKFNDTNEIESNMITLSYTVTLPKDWIPEREIHVHSVGRNGKNLFVTEKESGSPAIKSDPQGKRFLFQDENLWLFDSETQKVKQLTKDAVGNFNREEIVMGWMRKNGDVLVHWTDKPSWNPSGRVIAYQTNRKEAGTSGMSIWTVDPVSGDEKPVISAPYGLQTLGWQSESIIVFEERAMTPSGDRWDIKTIDINTEETKTLLQDVRFISMNSEFLFYGDDNGPLSEIYAYNFKNDSKTLLATARQNHTFDLMGSISPDDSRVLLKSRDLNGRQLITVVNLYTMNSNILQGPWGHMITSDPIWLDNNRIMIETLNENPAGKNRSATWIYRF